MLETRLAKWFKEHDFFWSVKGKGRVIPDEFDIELALDEAARLLYNELPGTQLQVGRLIITKTTTGHDVYVFAGTYE